MAVTQIFPPVQPAAAADDTNTAPLQLQLRCIAGIPRFSRALKTLGAGMLDPLALAKYGTFPKAGYWVPKQAYTCSGVPSDFPEAPGVLFLLFFSKLWWS